MKTMKKFKTYKSQGTGKTRQSHLTIIPYSWTEQHATVLFQKIFLKNHWEFQLKPDFVFVGLRDTQTFVHVKS